jgi:lactoylglutathione lyase
MEYLHTMVRVADLKQSLDFYVNKLGLAETRRTDNDDGRYTAKDQLKYCPASR